MADTLIVEDGTGRPDADSYRDLAAALDYFTKRHVVARWEEFAPTDEAKCAAMRYAAQQLDDLYPEWIGYRRNDLQARAMPRYDLIDTEGLFYAADVVPERFKDAQCELALLHVDGRPVNEAATMGIDSADVGPVAVDFVEGVTIGELDLSYVERLVARYANSGRGVVRLHR